MAVVSCVPVGMQVLRTLNNFSSLTAIISGLNAADVQRLKLTWERVKPRHLSTLEELMRLMDNNRNFAQYRIHLKVGVFWVTGLDGCPTCFFVDRLSLGHLAYRSLRC